MSSKLAGIAEGMGRRRVALAFAVVVLAASVTAFAVLILSGPGSRTAAGTAQGSAGAPGGVGLAPAPLATRVAAEADESPWLSGTFVRQHPGRDGIYRNADDRDHLAAGATMPICTPAQLAAADVTSCYSSNPPTSGMHSGPVAPWGVLPSPAPKEALVHNMEHGGVVVWYNTSNAAVIGELSMLVTAMVADGRLVVMSSYSGMEADTIAVTSWTRLDKFAARDFTVIRVRYFIRDNERRFNPEGF